MFVNPQKIAQANQHPANRAALARLKEAGQSVMADEEVHLIALAKWGYDEGNARAPSLGEGENQDLRDFLDRTYSKDPDDLMRWLTTNPNGPDERLEQSRNLRVMIEGADSPARAALWVLDEISSRLAADDPPSWAPAASELT